METRIQNTTTQKEQQERQETEKRIKVAEQAIQKLHPSWPQYKARWMAIRMIMPNQEQK